MMSTHTCILFFISSAISINYMKYTILYYKIDFVLGDFAQL